VTARVPLSAVALVTRDSSVALSLPVKVPGQSSISPTVFAVPVNDYADATCCRQHRAAAACKA
jgi:hypothetical protein